MHLDKKIYNIDTYKDIDVKIVQISDIHFSIGYKLKRLSKLFFDIDNINPDYVCIVGDLVDSYDVVKTNYIDYLKDWLKLLSYKYKVIVSLGNHDFFVRGGKNYIEHDDINWLLGLKSDNLVILNNDVYSENGINFIGYNPNFEYYYLYKEKKFFDFGDISKLLNNLKGYNILMVHPPSLIVSNYKNINGFNLVDLVLSGHTHGGLIPSFFPGSFGIISPCKRLFPSVVRGRVRCGKSDIIISSGVVKLSRKSKISLFNDVYGYNINVINIKKVV